MAARKCAIALLRNEPLKVNTGKEKDGHVCLQQLFVNRLQVTDHHVTTMIGIATEVVLQEERVG